LSDFNVGNLAFRNGNFDSELAEFEDLGNQRTLLHYLAGHFLQFEFGGGDNAIYWATDFGANNLALEKALLGLQAGDFSFGFGRLLRAEFRSEGP